jgi:tetratricopeptide (TPR) repeat protein
MAQKRLGLLERIKQQREIREDVHKRAIKILVELGYHEEALKTLEEETFVPLEMDQSFHGIYVQALMQRVEEKFQKGEVESAIADYWKMLEYPANLGVGAPTNKSQARILFNLGLAYEKIGKFDAAIKTWQEAAREHHGKGEELFQYVQKSLDKLSRYSALGFDI